MQIGSDSSSIDTDLLDALNITQNDEKKERFKKQNEKMFKEFGFELNVKGSGSESSKKNK